LSVTTRMFVVDAAVRYIGKTFQSRSACHAAALPFFDGRRNQPACQSQYGCTTWGGNSAGPFKRVRHSPCFTGHGSIRFFPPIQFLFRRSQAQRRTSRNRASWRRMGPNRVRSIASLFFPGVSLGRTCRHPSLCFRLRYCRKPRLQSLRQHVFRRPSDDLLTPYGLFSSGIHADASIFGAGSNPQCPFFPKLGWGNSDPGFRGADRNLF